MCMREKLPIRKCNRLNEYDYSNEGYYFITICIKDRKNILGNINVGENSVLPQYRNIILTEIGIRIKKEIEKIKEKYINVVIDKYVIMPNHIHMIIIIADRIIGRTEFSPTISRIIKQFKGSISKQIGFSIWQKSYHDHIIRNELEYNRIWQYINTNIQNWEKDYFY